MEQKFRVELIVKTDTDVEVDDTEVLDWIYEQFEGSDLGTVSVIKVTEET